MLPFVCAGKLKIWGCSIKESTLVLLLSTVAKRLPLDLRFCELLTSTILLGSSLSALLNSPIWPLTCYGLDLLVGLKSIGVCEVVILRFWIGLGLAVTMTEDKAVSVTSDAAYSVYCLGSSWKSFFDLKAKMSFLTKSCGNLLREAIGVLLSNELSLRLLLLLAPPPPERMDESLPPVSLYSSFSRQLIGLPFEPS